MNSKKNIYLISATLDDKIIYKIGFTKRDVTKRVKELKTGNPYEFNIERVYEAKEHGISIEGNLHKYFQKKKINREWFELNNEDIKEFIPLCEKYYEMFKIVSEGNTWMEDNGYEFK